MSLAAVPAYLGQDFSEASPGLRFGLYLPIWTSRTDQEAEVAKRASTRSREGQDLSYALSAQGMDKVIHDLIREKRLPTLWEKNNFAAREAWQGVCELSDADRQRMLALSARQHMQASGQAADAVLALHAVATAPFCTGLGNAHPLENGFAFSHPHGLPYLPGSGIKGVLRQAALELASGEWGASDWSQDRRHILPSSGLELSDIEVLFGMAVGDGSAVRGVLSFWDALPVLPKSHNLHVEIMTPHQSHYYQQKPVAGSASPHDSGSPNPISFLTVPPGAEFAFYVTADVLHLRDWAPDLAVDGRWQVLLTEAFAHAFAWLGFGAKTAVGYGAMRHHVEKENQMRQQAADAARVAAELQRQNSMTPAQREVDAFVHQCQKRFEDLRGRRDNPNTEWHNKARALVTAALNHAEWTAADKQALVQAITEWLPKVVQVDMKDERRKLKLSQLMGQG